VPSAARSTDCSEGSVNPRLLGVSSNIDVTALTLVPAVAAKGMAIPASRTPPRQHTPRSALTRMAI
jgi:hypothetical protein